MWVSLDARQLSVSSSHSSLPAREWWGGLCVTQKSVTLPTTSSSWLPQKLFPFSYHPQRFPLPQGSQRRRPVYPASLCLQPAMAPLKGNSQTAQLGARGRSKSSPTHYCSAQRRGQFLLLENYALFIFVSPVPRTTVIDPLAAPSI